MQNVFDKNMSRWVMKTAHKWAKARAVNSKQPYSVIFKRCLQQAHIKAAQMLDQHRQMREHVLSALNNELFNTCGCGVAVQLRMIWNVLIGYNPFETDATKLVWGNLDRENGAFYRVIRDLLDDLDIYCTPFIEAPSVREVRAKLVRFAA